MKALNFRTTVFFYLAGIVVIHLAVLWNLRQMIAKGYPDFTIYYGAGTMVRHGQGRQLYSEPAQLKVQKEFSPEVASRIGAVPYNHPPFEAALFAPLTYFSYPVAFVGWDLLNLAMMVALPFLLRPHLLSLVDIPWPLRAGAGLAFFPIFFTLLEGQDSILLLFLYALGFGRLVKGKDMAAGAWLALGLFKPHLVIPFIVCMFLYGRRKILYGFLPVAAILAMISAALVGWEGFKFYPQYVMQTEITLARTVIVPSNMPNLRGVLYLLAGGGKSVDVIVITLSILIFLFSAWQGRRAESSGMFVWQFALALVATVVVSYHSLAYDLSILFLPILLLVNEERSLRRLRSWPDWVTICALAVLFFSPPQLLLLLRFNRLALLGWPLLLWMIGIAAQISARTRHADLSHSPS